MTVTRTVEEKVGDWLTAYRAVKQELTPQPFVELASLANPGNMDNVQLINIGTAMARIVFANDRAAATVAALLTQSGIKPTGIDYGEGIE